MATSIGEKIEYRTFGEGSPAYQVLKVKKDTVVIKVLESGEIIENYPISSYLKDPTC